MKGTLEAVHVGMAEIRVGDASTHFSCLGLGSCIGLAVVDFRANVAGMVHIMLPQHFDNRPVDKPGKFADTGIPELLRLVRSAGGDTARLKVAYAGGAQVFKFAGKSTDGTLEVGNRNIDAVKRILAELRLKALAVDVGGSQGRTVNFFAATGEFKVRTVTQGEATLCNLR